MRRVLWCVWLLLPATAWAEIPPGALELQQTIHQVIEKAEPSVACVLVSRSGKYAELNEVPSPAIPGKLGGFNPIRHMRLADGVQLALVKRLDLADPEAVPDSFGSGVVLDATGLILTNYHVIEKATKIYVRLPGDSKGSYADIIGADSRADLAVLRVITPLTLKPITFGDGTRVRKGDWIVSLANLLGTGFRDGSPSASWGIISNIRRRGPGPTDEVKRTKPLTQYATLLQTDARLNFGCSGGAILNLNGELIGLSTSLAALTGGETAGGYAIPMSPNTRKIIDVLKQGQEVEYGFLGVSVQPDDKPVGGGILVRDVSPGTPAARAGIRGGDYITAIDGAPMREHDDLFLHIATALAGNESKITLRGGRTVSVRLVKASHSEPFIAANRPRPVHGITVDYLSTIPGDGAIESGVLIREIVPGSDADRKMGKKAANTRLVVVSVDGIAVNTPAEFYRAAQGKSRLTLDVADTDRDSATPREKVTLP
ncbi:trypsin-like peptidase domain-containing protein [Zavarzinella formosa]|uniref:trypsin-like peptidase domain-containing protein n=1 Tax=Zavarzinella formosa TaxID=360055 RepID=UPI00036B4A4E|nr:trypsin-like peptidase domain-containing protein [Zavarzinella formosa]